MCWSLPKAVCFIRRLYSSPSFNRQPPAKGVYNVLEAGVYRGLARYAWLRMVRNQVSVRISWWLEKNLAQGRHPIVMAGRVPRLSGTVLALWLFTGARH